MSEVHRAMIRLISVLVSLAVLAHSQEIKSIDLTQIVQRTELRFPPDPSQPDSSQSDGRGFGGGYGGIMVGCGASDIRDPHALGVYLESVSSHEIDPKNLSKRNSRSSTQVSQPLKYPSRLICPICNLQMNR